MSNIQLNPTVNIREKGSWLIPPAGECVQKIPRNKTYFSLEELQEAVDGYIEVLYLQNNRLLILNEEGKLIGLPPNFRATEIAQENGIDDYVVGNALIIDKSEMR